MRIAHVTDFYAPRLGGIEAQVADLAACQRAAGHDVEVITSQNLDGVAADPAVHRVAEGLFGNRYRPAGMRRSRQLLREGGYDVVHAHLGLISPMTDDALRTAAKAGLPVVATLHSLTSYLSPLLAPLNRLTGWAEWPVLWTAVSAKAAESLRRLPALANRVEVLPNGIDISSWRPVAGSPVVRGGGPDEVVLLSVMRLVARKRALPLMRMLREIGIACAESGQPVRAVVIGDGPQQAEVARYAKRHGMDWVELTGRLDRPGIRGLMAGADVFVAPCRLESFGIAALEARCAGLPVVGRSESGLVEFIRHGTDGLLVGSDAEMVTAVTALATQRELRQRIAEHNVRTVPALDWRQIAALTERLYAGARALAGAPDLSRADPLLCAPAGTG